jgi:excisionase family DNA binding protein
VFIQIQVKGMKEVLTTREACTYLRISKPTFFKLVHSGHIRARKVGRRWRVLKSELEAHLRQEDTPDKSAPEIEKFQEASDQWGNVPSPAKVLSSVDQNILRILSLYEHLTLLQLWYEMGEDDALGRRLTEKETERRLQVLTMRGFVENIGDSDSAIPKYRLRTAMAWTEGKQEVK